MKKQKLTLEESQKKIIGKITNKMKMRAVKCPYCGYKVQVHHSACPQCKLTKHQMIMASNTLAKQIKKQKTGEKIVMSRHLPFDVSYTRLLLYNIFLGWWLGMHCFYVGRNWRAIIITACWWVFAIGYTILIKLEEQQGMLGQALGIIGAIGIVMSAWDLSKILFGSFRVPVRMGEMSHASKPKYT